MILTDKQREILLIHVAEPQAYIARGGRPVRHLIAHGLLGFTQRNTKTRITRRGCDQLQAPVRRPWAHTIVETHP